MKKIFSIAFLLFSLSAMAQGKFDTDGDLAPTGNYAIVKAKNLRGGFWAVYDIAARDAIASFRRDTGMVIYLTIDGTSWQLQGGVANSNWVAYSTGVPYTGANNPVNLGSQSLTANGLFANYFAIAGGGTFGTVVGYLSNINGSLTNTSFASKRYVDSVLAAGFVPDLPATQIAFGDVNGKMTSSSNLSFNNNILDVVGDVQIDAGLNGNILLQTGNEVLMGDVTGTYINILGNGNGNTIKTFGDNIIFSNLTDTAKVGINTRTPTVALDVVGQVKISQVLKLSPLTFATLPASPEIGMIAHISDSDTSVWGDTILGGGEITAIVFFNGTSWTVMGK